MADLPASLKAVIDSVRGIPGQLNLRPFAVSVIKRTWTGERVGLGTSTTTSTALTVGGQNPRLERLSSREVLASAGKFAEGDYRLTLTPSFSGGGFNISDFSSDDGVNPAEIYFKVTGNGFEPTGSFFVKVDQDVHSNLTYKIVIRRTAQQP
jgi:hypothetical protein